MLETIQNRERIIKRHEQLAQIHLKAKFNKNHNFDLKTASLSYLPSQTVRILCLVGAIVS